MMLAAGCFVNIATHLAFYGFGLSGVIYLMAFFMVGGEMKMGVNNLCRDPESAKNKNNDRHVNQNNKNSKTVQNSQNSSPNKRTSLPSGNAPTISGPIFTSVSAVGGVAPGSTDLTPGKARVGRAKRISSHGVKRGSICYFDKEQVFRPKAERTMSITRRASGARQIGMRKLKMLMSLQKEEELNES